MIITKDIKESVRFAKAWSKEYLESMYLALNENRFEDALQIASELAPIWGDIEMTVQEAIESQEK